MHERPAPPTGVALLHSRRRPPYCLGGAGCADVRGGGGPPASDRRVEDLVFAGDHPEPPLTEGRDRTARYCLVAPPREGPLGGGQSEGPGSTEGEVEPRRTWLVGTDRRTAQSPLGLEHRHPGLVEGAFHITDVVPDGDGGDRGPRRGVPPVARENDLGAPGLDRVLTETGDPSELRSFVECQVADPGEPAYGTAPSRKASSVQGSGISTGRALNERPDGPIPTTGPPRGRAPGRCGGNRGLPPAGRAPAPPSRGTAGRIGG